LARSAFYDKVGRFRRRSRIKACMHRLTPHGPRHGADDEPVFGDVAQAQRERLGYPNSGYGEQAEQGCVGDRPHRSRRRQ
jgi:hypothetical protein